ncbi:hypothetical protein EVAR_34729_1 [Eumeta japonica]|uniref:Uncharacterized protein n=1 Tax=Eumeta variegata TaxID=151549 RepID=A0A4C1XET1_EUMVA|nr:hypothetical protein EVAR_34729_1 [Eumeta japonica]
MASTGFSFTEFVSDLRKCSFLTLKAHSIQIQTYSHVRSAASATSAARDLIWLSGSVNTSRYLTQFCYNEGDVFSVTCHLYVDHNLGDNRIVWGLYGKWQFRLIP